MKARHLIALSALLALTVPTLASAQDEAAQTCSAAKPKKKGFGLGGLLSAARRAGVGDMLTGRAGNLLGSGKGGQIMGAVTGTALGAIEGGVSGAAPALPIGGGRGAQIAGAVTGMAMEAARSAGASQGGCAGAGSTH